MARSDKVNFSFLRRVAADTVSESLASAGYKPRTIDLLTARLSDLIDKDYELNDSQAKIFQNELLALLDGESLGQEGEDVADADN